MGEFMGEWLIPGLNTRAPSLACFGHKKPTFSATIIFEVLNVGGGDFGFWTFS